MFGFNVNNFFKVKLFFLVNCCLFLLFCIVLYIGWFDLEFCICLWELEFCGGCCLDCLKICWVWLFFLINCFNVILFR